MKRLTLGQRIGSVACLIVVTVAAALFYFIAKGFSKDSLRNPGAAGQSISASSREPAAKPDGT